jgi:hypothetical protein
MTTKFLENTTYIKKFTHRLGSTPILTLARPAGGGGGRGDRSMETAKVEAMLGLEAADEWSTLVHVGYGANYR